MTNRSEEIYVCLFMHPGNNCFHYVGLFSKQLRITSLREPDVLLLMHLFSTAGRGQTGRASRLLTSSPLLCSSKDKMLIIHFRTPCCDTIYPCRPRRLSPCRAPPPLPCSQLQAARSPRIGAHAGREVLLGSSRSHVGHGQRSCACEQGQDRVYARL